MRHAIVLIPVAALLACGSPSHPAEAAPSPVNSQQIVDRFTHAIWPAVAAYNAEHNQGGQSYQSFTMILATGLDPDRYNALREAAQKLGQHTGYDAATQTTHSNDGLHLGTASVLKHQPDIAAVDACYTYTHYWYINAEDTHHAPAASEATFGLSNQDGTWMLSSISDDRVVPSCPPNKA